MANTIINVAENTVSKSTSTQSLVDNTYSSVNNTTTNAIDSVTNGITDTTTSLIDSAGNTITNTLQNGIDQLTGQLDQYVDTSKLKEYSKDITDDNEKFSTDKLLNTAQDKIEKQKEKLEKDLSSAFDKLKWPDFKIEEQKKKIKETIDKKCQEIADIPEKIITSIEDNVKKVLNLIDGWVDTSEQIVDSAALGQMMENMLNEVIDQLNMLPLPSIASILNCLKSMIAQVKNISMPNVESMIESITSSASIDSITEVAQDATETIQNTTRRLITVDSSIGKV